MDTSKNAGRNSVDTGTTGQESMRPAELDRLNDLIGNWINTGETIGQTPGDAQRIATSDIYEWVPGRQFVLHRAYGRLGDVDVGAVEIIGFDSDTRQFKCYSFDSFGNVSHQTLTRHENVLRWEGDGARCTAKLTNDGATLDARHERSDEGGDWQPSMNVVLKKVR